MAKKIETLEALYLSLYRNSWDAMPFDSTRNDWAWAKFWELLIQIGFRFDPKSLVNLRGKYAENYYQHRVPFHRPDEGHYTQAVILNNISFCGAYEELVGRKPFITKNIDYGYLSNHSVEGYKKGTGSKSQGRLVLGAEFSWKDERVKVTSFQDAKQSLVACAYHPTKDRYESTKIRKRFTIMHEEFLKNRTKSSNCLCTE